VVVEDRDLDRDPAPAAAPDQAAGTGQEADPSLVTGAGASPVTGPSPVPGLALVATTNGRMGTETSRDLGASPGAGQDQVAVAAIKREINI